MGIEQVLESAGDRIKGVRAMLIVMTLMVWDIRVLVPLDDRLFDELQKIMDSLKEIEAIANELFGEEGIVDE